MCNFAQEKCIICMLPDNTLQPQERYKGGLSHGGMRPCPGTVARRRLLSCSKVRSDTPGANAPLHCAGSNGPVWARSWLVDARCHPGNCTTWRRSAFCDRPPPVDHPRRSNFERDRQPVDGTEGWSPEALSPLIVTRPCGSGLDRGGWHHVHRRLIDQSVQLGPRRACYRRVAPQLGQRIRRRLRHRRDERRY